MDPNNELDLYSLHYMFLPLIQKQLDCFRHAWAHYPFRTERSRTPQQLWITGLQAMNMADEDHPALTETSVVSIVPVNVLQCLCSRAQVSGCGECAHLSVISLSGVKTL